MKAAGPLILGPRPIPDRPFAPIIVDVDVPLKMVQQARVIKVTALTVGAPAALPSTTHPSIALLPLAEVGIRILPEFAASKRWSF